MVNIILYTCAHWPPDDPSWRPGSESLEDFPERRVPGRKTLAFIMASIDGRHVTLIFTSPLVYPQKRSMMRKLVVLGGAAVIVAAAAACSSTPSTKSGTETITGTASGQSAATQLNSNNSTLIFQTFAYTGPVSTTVANYSLPGGNNNAKTQTGTLKTSVGNLTITHTRTYQPSDNTPPTLTGKSGNVCTFTLVGEKGTYVTVPASSTGQFKDATGHGNYVITINIGAALPAGKTTCNINDYGANGPKAVATGSSILFKASGPLTVTP